MATHKLWIGSVGKKCYIWLMNEKTGPKDVFLQLLNIIALYVSAGMFISLIFSYIDIWMPDALSENYYTLLAARSSVRWAIASLIVVFPVYIWATWFLNKILAVLAAAGGVFGYYILDIKNKAPQKIFAYGVSAIMLIAIVAGFFVAGSPKEERARRFDDQRTQHLQMIQSEIINFWIKKAALPKTLEELNDPIRGVAIPKDPESGAEYVYEITDKENFKLCATFNQPSLDQASASMPKRAALSYPLENIYYGNENWAHNSGQTCFDRKIDKDLYKPEKPR